MEAGEGILEGKCEIQEEVHQFLDHGVPGTVSVEPGLLFHQIKDDQVRSACDEDLSRLNSSHPFLQEALQGVSYLMHLTLEGISCLSAACRFPAPGRAATLPDAAFSGGYMLFPGTSGAAPLGG